MVNDGQELPTEHTGREEQTNSDNNLDIWVQHLVRPQVVTCMITVTALGAPAHISTLIVHGGRQQHFKAFSKTLTYLEKTNL